MTLSNGNIFCVTGFLWGEFTGHRWIPPTKASDGELWCFLWFLPEPTFEQTMEMPVIWDAIALNMTSLQCGWMVHNKDCNDTHVPDLKGCACLHGPLRDSKDPRIGIDSISIRCESVGSMSNRCRSEILCYLGLHMRKCASVWSVIDIHLWKSMLLCVM